ncbi:Eco57I restriction-modification methylase domain-containing protein [Haloarchaeobius sp. TZWSO28]|uniref:Eco57I restriction-modification methylase domain-containing protein n=1 Tax=Haloarchaeobius sp. TZWSO28 TaxID=3446119 RepID=UPI003EBF2C73
MQTSLTYRTNRDLFSNYYLDEHLPETEEWDEVSDDELREAREEILELWNREKSTAPKRNESQLEEKFIRPMFRKLGIPFEVEESTSRTQRRPDYGFFESEDAARGAFERREEGGDFYKDTVAVADAKRWGRPLDTRGSGEHERDFENPSYQIHVYLQETPARWAVLTDGKKWRLYYGPTSHRLDSYYEIDLPTVLEKGNLEDFKYFYLFFRHEAFLEDAGGDSFLDDVYGESNVFAQELGEDLQDNIYEAIKVLAEGFIQHPDNDLGEDDLERIHDSSLIYLYRLIFVLYAESEGRDLLNTNNDIYEASYSLNSLKQEIAEELDSADPKYRGWQDNLWSRLEELFKLIDQGSKSLGIPEEDLYIPAYNGGLFRTNPEEDDSTEARFLATHEVGDSYLARVIELLTRSANGNGGKIFVDYSSLDVRHLGSIYEGLLEYKLNIADEPLALDDGEYVTAADGDEVVVEEGEVHLTTGSGERKATGSYYTPEYVVEYIVENTLEPLVTDIRQDLVAQSARGERGFAAEFADRVFDLKILDPAMGSGHFLTSAVDYLAREIIDAQEKQAAQQGIETVNQEHDINWARRQVAQRCIYGVDLNPLAVELAKVSLWLRTLAAEQPLAFLDHHLKTGNSLVGSDIEEIEELESDAGGDNQNASLADFGIARKGTIEQLMRIYEDFIAIENQDLADVKEMEAKYDEFERNKLRQRLEAMTNVHTAQDFGLDSLPSDSFERMAAALEDDDKWAEIAQMQWFQDAQSWADSEYYFHWKLEYPEVYYDESGSTRHESGFDAVIGNPPYVNISQLPKEQREYLSVAFPETYAGNSDILYYFMQRGLDVLHNQGILGLIVARYFAEARYADGLREYLLSHSRVKKIVDFGNFQAFPGVDVLTDIVFCVREDSPEDYDVSILKLDEDDVSDDFVQKNLPTESPEAFSIVDLDVNTLSKHPWNLIDETTLQIKQKMDSLGWPLGNHYDIVQSMQTGFNEGLVVDQETIQEYNLEQDLLRKLAKTKNIRRYLIKDLGEYVLWTEVEDIDMYPNTKAYLQQYRDDLEDRYDIKARNANWWQISNPRNEELFDRDEPRILTPFMSTSNKFSIDTEKRFNDGGDVRALFEKNSANVSMRYVLAILNSALGEFYHKNTAKLKRDGYYEYYGNALENFPVYQISVGGDEVNAADEAKAQYKDYLNGDSDSVAWVEDNADELAEHDAVIHELLTLFSEQMRELREQRFDLNLHLLDYLGSYNDGASLKDIDGYEPPSGVGDSILTETTETKANLRVGSVKVEAEGPHLLVLVSARYKPQDPDQYETDRWGYTETDHIPAMRFKGLDSKSHALIREFVEYAVNEEDDGFADFRSSATKNNSLVDRLEELTLPAMGDVRSGLSRYLDTADEANRLETQINKTDELINRIVFSLYELDDPEIQKVNTFISND